MADTDRKNNESTEALVVPAQYRKAKKLSWAGRFYDVLDIEDREERRLLFKLDAVLVTFMSCGYFLKYLDQTNVNSAFVSGMKEDLNMYGNQLTTAITMWTIGYALGQIPSNLLLTRVSPRWWIPTLELVWGLCTLFSYKVKTYQGLYAIRFFVGLAEAGFYPGAQYILGSFYKPHELGKRVVFFHTFAGVGTLCSSALQAATYSGLNGVNGLSGWQYLFIIDAVITLPIAVAGYIFLPPLPGQKEANKGTFWLSTREWTIIDRRIAEIGRAPANKMTAARLKKIALGWHVYVLPVLYILWNNSGNASSIMPLWLKSFNTVKTGTGLHYTVPQINHYVMPIQAVYIVTAWFFGWTSDSLLRGRRWVWPAVTTLLNAAVCLTLANIPLYKHIKGHFVLYYLTQVTGGMSGLLFSWANEICSTDNEERALVVALMNDLAYVLQAIAPNFVWKQTDYPKAERGLYYSTGLSLAFFFWIFLTLYLHKRDQRRAQLEQVPATPESDTESIEKEVLPAVSGQSNEWNHAARSVL
ncbi:hypothetical protein JCM10908_006183 [Rhodotorula pacifica]|uniref:uncharacterized protein n=1 Tax=Rhodotorula pacifica TaxID=1495444 RepID=UPI00317F98CE